MLSLNSMIPMSYHYLWASTITTINTSPHGQGDTCGWPANMDQIEHSPIWKGLRLHHSRAYVFFLAYHCLVFFPCWRGYFTHTLSCNTLRESCLPFQWQSWRSYGYHLTPGFSVINQSGIVVLYLGGNSAELACFEAWRCQDTICGYKSAVPWIVKMVSFWWSRDFDNNKSRKLKGRLGKVNSIRGKLVAGNRHESRVFWWMGSGKIVFVSTGMRFILFHQQNSSETSEPLRWHGNKTRVLCNNLWFAKGPQFQVQVLVEVQSLYPV